MWRNHCIYKASPIYISRQIHENTGMLCLPFQGIQSAFQLMIYEGGCFSLTETMKLSKGKEFSVLFTDMGQMAIVPYP